MRSIPFLPTTLALSIAVIGAFTVNANEITRTTTKTVFFSNSHGTVTLTASGFIFDDSGITCVAAIKDNNGTYVQLYENSNLTAPVRIPH